MPVIQSLIAIACLVGIVFLFLVLSWYVFVPLLIVWLIVSWFKLIRAWIRSYLDKRDLNGCEINIMDDQGVPNETIIDVDYTEIKD